ncbi:hypothetical protein [Fibrobacter sp. UWB3]|uniref:AbiTii domain-containing protein n=1 Tax=Fibrobacter sp. UWB3 TaxID=1964357 RepID=UPI000B520791|nr:hypothetical protein [Fibrobacter sp. UWB3]OWV19272.1 hypothetical protein B7991_08445 [Fibrobacter sp. UWB3]
MAKMVLDLQQACLDEKVSCYYLLLRAYAIAEKLSIKDMAEFCSNEMTGYKSDDTTQLPLYRQIIIYTEAFDVNLQRWVPISLSSENPINKRNVIEPITEIEKLSLSKTETLEIRPTAEVQQIIFETTNMPKAMDIHHIVSIAQLASIPQIVRKLVLDWALKLEKEGILGDNLKFSSEEQSKVKDIPSIQIIINGNVSNSNLAGVLNDSISSIQTQRKE